MGKDRNAVSQSRKACRHAYDHGDVISLCYNALAGIV